MGKRILVVDDDVMNLKMAEFILEKKQYEVLKAESGMECLSCLKTEKVDLVLLDLEMPVLNGLKTLERIREDREISDVPVIFLSAASDPVHEVEAGRLGALDFINKPFKPMDFLERVGKVLENKR